MVSKVLVEHDISDVLEFVTSWYLVWVLLAVLTPIEGRNCVFYLLPTVLLVLANIILDGLETLTEDDVKVMSFGLEFHFVSYFILINYKLEPLV